MSEVTEFQVELYRLFAENDTIASILPKVIEHLNSSYSPSCFALTINFGYHVSFHVGDPATLSEAKRFNKSDQYNGTLFSNSPIPNNEDFSTLIQLLSQRSLLEAENLHSSINTTLRILGITFHDMRNTLGSISGIAQLMEMDADGNDEILKSVQDIISIVNKFDQDSTTTMKLLRNQDLHYPRTLFNLSETFEKILTRNSRVYQLSSIEVESSIEPGIEFSGDEERIREVFSELLINAASALESAGGKMAVSVAKAEGKVTIIVEHNGDPINTGRQEYIFMPFFTTKDKGRGTGLTRINRYLSDWGGSIEYHTSSECPVKFVAQLPITL